MSSIEPLEPNFGRYQLRTCLARGGMASVYLAQAKGAAGFEKWVALKVIHPHLSEDDRFVRMFLDEARLSAQLSHPNVGTVFDFGEVDGAHYLAMEYLRGEPLRSVVEQAQAGCDVPLELATRMVADAAWGLHSAHELADENGQLLGVVHRDVSPENIFVLYDGVAKVVDFGIARARDRLTETTSGEIKGKTAYMAPEQFDGRDVDRRTDVFALGIVLWEATTLKRLFKRASTAQTIAAIIRKESIPEPTSLRSGYPGELERVVLRALKHDPAERYETMADLAEDLETCVVAMGKPAGAAQVAAWMKETFDDRISERSVMLRSGPGTPVSLPSSEPKRYTSGKAISGSPNSDRELEPSLTPRPTRPSQWRPSTLVVVSILLISVGVASGLWFANRGLPDQGADHDVGSLQGSPVADAGSRGASPEGGAKTDGRTRGDGATLDVGDAGRTSSRGDGSRADSSDDGEAGPSPLGIRAAPGDGKANRVGAKRPGYLNLLSVPVAHVWTGRRKLGTTPLRRVPLPPGAHVIKLQQVSGEATKRARVHIQPGKVSHLVVRF